VEKANATPTGLCHSIYKYARLCIAVKSTKGIRKMVGDMMMQQLVEMCQDARMMVKKGAFWEVLYEQLRRRVKWGKTSAADRLPINYIQTEIILHACPGS